MKSCPTDTSTVFHCIFEPKGVFDLWHTKLHWILAYNICLGGTGPQNLVLHPSWVWFFCVLSNSRHCSFRVMAYFGHPPILAPLVHLGTTTNNTNCTSIDISQHSLSQQHTLQTNIPPSNMFQLQLYVIRQNIKQELIWIQSSQKIKGLELIILS